MPFKGTRSLGGLLEASDSRCYRDTRISRFGTAAWHHKNSRNRRCLQPARTHEQRKLRFVRSQRFAMGSGCFKDVLILSSSKLLPHDVSFLALCAEHALPMQTHRDPTQGQSKKD